MMRELNSTEIEIVGGGWGEVARQILIGVIINGTYDALKAIIAHVPKPRELTDEEIRRIQEEAEKIKPTTPPPGGGGIEPAISALAAFIGDLTGIPSDDGYMIPVIP